MRSPARSRLAVFAYWLLASSPLAASALARAPQAETDRELAAPASYRQAFGGHADAGGAVAGGPDYKAHFRPGRTTLTAALGRAAQRNQTLSFAFEELLRGESVVARATADAEPVLGGDTVRFEHAGVVERYRVVREGLQQSFVVPAPPVGSGDLVVRGRLETELPLTRETAAGGLVFELPGVGGIGYGAVTGVAADGATAAGCLRLDGDRIELRIPAEFVDRAAYPLVVDPLIGPNLILDDTAEDDVDPDVAASSTTGRYLVVWQRIFSAVDADVRAVRLDEKGAPLGGLLAIEAGLSEACNASVASVADVRRFLVVWEERIAFQPPVVRARAVGALDGKLSGDPIVNEAGPAFHTEPDVGGERAMDENGAFVVWKRGGTGIVGRRLTVPLEDDPKPAGGTIVIADDFGTGDFVRPAISKSAGDAGRYMLAWDAGDDVVFRLITRDGKPIGGAVPMVTVTGGPHNNPDCDGDGTDFMVVWERGENFGTISNDLHALSVSFFNDGISLNAHAPIEENLNDDEVAPSVVFNGAHFVVAYSDFDITDYQVYVKPLDPYTCLVGDTEIIAGGTAGDDLNVALASSYGGGISGDTVMLAWESADPAAGGDVLGQLFESTAGASSLGGACGGGGRASTPCPYAGNQNFTLHVRDAAPVTGAFLVLALDPSPLACGPCTIWPSLAAPQVIFAGITGAAGNLGFPVPLATGLLGLELTSQWGVQSGASCDLFGVDLSDGVATTVLP
ncbi:MAG: hypothetical protein AAF682_14945 [Planctomycetota bacterium]